MNILKENNQSTISIWLDCDPGHDDAFAIILAGWNKKLKLLGISTVLGNQTVEKTTLNALKILSVSGLENIEVVSGQHKPLLRPSIICPEIHGNSGLDCSVEFPPIYKKSKHCYISK
jgi:inosine-uridine nucleoside N-ribohydrolase